MFLWISSKLQKQIQDWHLLGFITEITLFHVLWRAIVDSSHYYTISFKTFELKIYTGLTPAMVPAGNKA